LKIDNKNITKGFKKDDRLEKVLFELNDELKDSFSDKLEHPNKPIILIMGCARSGSTLLLQYLSQTGLFSYPTNLIARFYKNPYLGIKIQQALLDFDPLNQIGFELTDKQYSSKLGKTFGALAPSEFWYFWRQYFDFSKRQYNFLNKENLSAINSDSFLKKIAAFELITSKPLVMKGMMLNWNIPFLHKMYDKFIFVNLERDIIVNGQSLLNARNKYFNDIETWYSFKPKEYDDLKNRPAQEQVIGQVYYTQKAVKEGLKLVPNKNKITISYENFCKNPIGLVEEVQKKFTQLNTKLSAKTLSEENKKVVFTPNKELMLSIEELESMSNFLKRIQS